MPNDPTITEFEIADGVLDVIEAMRVTTIGFGMSGDQLRVLARAAVNAIRRRDAGRRQPERLGVMDW